MPTKGRHACVHGMANYATNLRVYTCIRNNAGNLDRRLHGLSRVHLESKREGKESSRGWQRARARIM